MEALFTLDSSLFYYLDVSYKWTRSKGRAPYGIAWQHPTGGITIFYHVSLPHALVEISGKGCDFLTEKSSLEKVMTVVAHRVTRVDIACDMLTSTDPFEFVNAGKPNRFKSYANMSSESGDTCYVGSRSSNRYARVYRYNPPHERSHFLRCEFVIKAADAKMVVKRILETSVRSIAATFGDTFGWSHETWEIDASESAELAVYRPERHEGKTLFWLADTIAPLLARLHNEGIINVNNWVDENVIPKINE